MTSTSASAKNLNPHDNHAYMIYVPVAVFGVLCPALVGLRTWSRLRKGGKLGSDDYTIFLSLFFALASSAVMIASCQYGFGQHALLIPPGDMVQTLMYFYLCQITYKASINLTKASILLLYLRIFNKIRWFKWVCCFMIAAVTVYAIASVIATIFQCTPIRMAFDHSITDGKCIDNAKFWYANAGFSIATDLIILFLPMWLVHQLQIPMAQKVALILVFALGSFVVITSCLRITTINIIATTTDKTYDISSTMWTMIEMNVAIVCACLPMVRPLIVRLFPKLMPKSSSNLKYGASRGYGSKSFMGHSQTGAKNEWMEIGAARGPGIHMSSVNRAGSSTGSEENILAETRHKHTGSSNGIQKTVQYTVEYTDK